MGITPQQALDCFASHDLLALGLEADAVRVRLHPENVVTYVRQVRLDLTPTITPQQLQQAADAAREAGASSLLLHGVGRPLTTLLQHVEALRSLSPEFALTLTTSALHTALEGDTSKTREALIQFQHAGLTSLADADIAPLPAEAALLAVHRQAHGVGIPTSAALPFGHGGTPEQTVRRLERIRMLQSETGGFLALCPVPHRAPVDMAYAHGEEPTAIELLKTLAVCRLMADNIPHIEVSWAAAGAKVLQLALRFGADDAGSALDSTTGSDHEEEMRRIIREAGFRPAERELTYTSLAMQ